jgi:hypothetical protein
VIDSMFRDAIATNAIPPEIDSIDADSDSTSRLEPTEQRRDLTRAFVRLNNLPTCPLGRLSRYEATLWRQACQIVWTLQGLDRRKPWDRPKPR